MDELVWSALWIYAATDEDRYLNFAKNNYKEIKIALNDTNEEFSYDNKILGVQVSLTLKK